MANPLAGRLKLFMGASTRLTKYTRRGIFSKDFLKISERSEIKKGMLKPIFGRDSFKILKSN